MERINRLKLLYNIFKEYLFCQREYLSCRKHLKVDISKEYKFIYYKTAKTGSTTIGTVLRESVKDISVHRADSVSKLLKHEYDQYYHFAFVRNPWDRLVSCYRNLAGELLPRFTQCYGDQKFGSMGFDDFVRFVNATPDYYADMHFISQHYTANQKKMAFIGRYETFEVDLFRLLDIIIPDHKIEEIPHKRHINKDNKCYKSYYTDETRAIVARRYKRDIKLFNYQF